MRCCYLKFVESRVALISPISFERRLYHATFGLEDFKEGMAAFVRVPSRPSRQELLGFEI